MVPNWFLFSIAEQNLAIHEFHRNDAFKNQTLGNN